MRNGQSCAGQQQSAITVLPVIIIPGILSGNGDDGTFLDLEAFLRRESYRLRSDSSGYLRVIHSSTFYQNFFTSVEDFGSRVS